jgi:hypothetical protein
MTETLVHLGFGEIVSWKSPKECDFSDLVNSLVNAGLDATVAKALLARNAFIRGIRSMEEKRIIRKVRENQDEIVFQLNRIEKDSNGDGYEYPHETEISLEKSSGRVTCPDKNLEHDVQVLLNAEMERRTSGDITKVVQTLFQRAGSELIPIREQGGAYFVPAHMTQFVDKVVQFLGDIDGSVRRFGGLSGDGTRESLADAIGDHFETMIKEFRDTIQSLNQETSDDVRKRRSEKLDQIRQQLESYRGLLQLSAEEIGSQLDQAEREMFSKLNSVVEAGPPVAVAEPSVSEPSVSDDILSALGDYRA